jgi:hypothetical protein
VEVLGEEGRCFWEQGRRRGRRTEAFWGERRIFGRGAENLVANLTDFLPLRW